MHSTDPNKIAEHLAAQKAAEQGKEDSEEEVVELDPTKLVNLKKYSEEKDGRAMLHSVRGRTPPPPLPPCPGWRPWRTEEVVELDATKLRSLKKYSEEKDGRVLV